MKKYLIIILLVVALAIGVIYFGFKIYYGSDTFPPIVCTKETKQCPDGSYVGRVGPDCEFTQCTMSNDDIYRSSSVEYKNNKFIPSEIKIKKGGIVTWTNRDSAAVWPASGPHPTHSGYSGFDSLRGLNTGEVYSFTFDKVGSWKYHNHLNPSATGVVVVSE